MPGATPRLFILRHGETEWSLDGRHTGTTDIPLTETGIKRSIATGKALVGPDRLIVRANLSGIYVSPRTRSKTTLALLMGAEAGRDPSRVVDFEDPSPPDEDTQPVSSSDVVAPEEGKVRAKITPDVAEWDYGEYEGITSSAIRSSRAEKGEGGWDIWRDGCPGGESPDDVTERLDRFIGLVREGHHRPAFEAMAETKSTRGSKGMEESNGQGKGQEKEQAGNRKAPACDVLVVAHGHILRALTARWIGRDVGHNPNLILEAGGVGCLSYEHHNIDEPAILLGGGFVVDAVEAEKESASGRSQ